VERKMTSRLLSTAVIVAGATFAFPAAAAAGTLDQQQPLAPGTGLQVQSMQSVAQTFTAGLSGGLDQVDVNLLAAGTGVTLPLTVEIRNASGGSPGSTVLATASVPPAAVTTTAAFVPVTFATPAPVTAGTQYAIVAYSADVSPHIWSWSDAAMDPYPAGASYFQPASPPSAGSWTSFPGPDQTFKTYVAVPPKPPAATGKRAAAVKKCKKKHSKKKRRKCLKRAKRLPI
jgi:hypothetical protein